MDGFVYCLSLTASQAFGPPHPHTPNDSGFLLVRIKKPTADSFKSQIQQGFFCVQRAAGCKQRACTLLQTREDSHIPDVSG